MFRQTGFCYYYCEQQTTKLLCYMSQALWMAEGSLYGVQRLAETVAYCGLTPFVLFCV